MQVVLEVFPLFGLKNPNKVTIPAMPKIFSL